MAQGDPQNPSLPRWRPLACPDTRVVLAVSTNDGLAALTDLAAREPHAVARVEVIAEAGNGLDDTLVSAGFARIERVPDTAALLVALHDRLETAPVDFGLLLAGPESFLGAAGVVARARGIAGLAIVAEKRGAPSRRVLCMRCKHVLEDVRRSPARCPQCRMVLAVREHYSARHGAYQGLCANPAAPEAEPA